ncbi:MAG: metallophosphoesterase [Actinobacteria bacterium]|nr:metallophosphoesterase [Actinomycetota bacterium]
MRWLPRLTAATVVAGGACIAYGVFIERRWYRLRRIRVRDALADPSQGPLRVLHVSDLHLDPPQRPLERFVRSLAVERPDLVICTGDVLGAAGAEDAATELLAELTTEDTPAVMVLGSNDLYGPTAKSYHHYLTDPDRRIHGRRLDTDRLVRGLDKHGFTVLRDDTVVVETRAGRVAVGGIHDPHLKSTVLPPRSAIACDEPDVVARLGLVHAPYTAALDLLVEGGYDVLFAGHTHGGQVRFPPFGAVIGNCDLPLDQVRGLSRWRSAWLHVSPGLGTSRYAPFRFACRPEATLLELT